MKSLLIAVSLVLSAHLVSAATYTVTTNADHGAGSFRQGLLDANSGACSSPCRIDFAPGESFTITPDSPFPTITASDVEINAPVPNLFFPAVILDGRNAGFYSGLKSSGASKINIHGLAIINFQGHGIFFDGGSNNLAVGCIIGTDPRTRAAAPNGMNGVAARNVFSVLVGSNFIDSNDGNGVYMIGCTNASVGANEIGDGYLSGGPRPNHGYGVFMQDCVNSVVDNNGIDNNELSGIGIYGDRSRVEVGLFNRISSNGLLGIDIDCDGQTPNDPLDADSGANDRQNAPVITRAARSLAVVQIDVTLSSTPLTGTMVSIYDADPPNAYGAGQGRHLAAFNYGTTDANGNLSFTFILQNPQSSYVTALAQTFRTPNDRPASSEFTPAVPIVDAGLSYTVTSTADSGSGTLRQAIEDGNIAAASWLLPAVIRFSLPDSAGAAGVFTIAPRSALPALTNPNLVIDGTSQGAHTSVVLDGSTCAGPCNGLDSLWLTPSRGVRVLAGLTINGFSGHGISVRTGPEARSSPGTTRISGCQIGTDATGNVAVPNRGNGVDIEGSQAELGALFNNGIDGVLIHDSRPNIVSGNAGDGIWLTSVSGGLSGNLIGVGKDLGPVGNGGNGVTAAGSSFVRTYGGEIAFNHGSGIDETGGGRVALSAGTTVHDNGDLAIDLGSPGPTENDPGDIDSTPNSPTITSASFDASTGETTIAGTLEAAAENTTTWHILTVYASPYADPAGRGEGAEVAGTVQLTVKQKGQIDWTLKVKKDLSGQFVSATSVLFDWFAFSTTGATSELGPVMQVTTLACSGHPSAVQTAPAADAFLDAGKPVTFAWTDAAAASYVLWIRPLQQKPSTQPATTTRSETVTLPAGEYEWFVESKFNGCYSSYSIPQKLTLK